MASVGNSMSTTGPMTRAMRPTPPAVVSVASVTVAVISLSLTPGVGVSKRVHATDDLADFLGNASLASLVGDALVLLDQLVRVVRGRLHRLLASRQLRGRGLEQREEDPALDV